MSISDVLIICGYLIMFVYSIVDKRKIRKLNKEISICDEEYRKLKNSDTAIMKSALEREDYLNSKIISLESEQEGLLGLLRDRNSAIENLTKANKQLLIQKNNKLKSKEVVKKSKVKTSSKKSTKKIATSK